MQNIRYNKSESEEIDMEKIIKKADVENAQLLSDEEVKNLNFHELCLYIGLLDEMEEALEEDE